MNPKLFDLHFISSMLSIAFALAGTYFWIRPATWQTPKSIAGQAKIKSGFNETEARNLSSQTVDAKISFLLLFLAFLLQDAALVFPLKLSWLWRVLIFLGPLLFALFFLYPITNKISRCCSNKIYEQAVKLRNE